MTFSANALVASIIGTKSTSDSTDIDNSNTSQQPSRNTKRPAINDNEVEAKGHELESIEPEPSKKPKWDIAQESNEGKNKELEEDYLSTLS